MQRTFNRFIAFALLALASVWAQAQSLTAPQLATLCAACKGAAACDTPRQIGDSVSVRFWLNAPRAPVALAWYVVAPVAAVEEAPTYTSYDSLVAGKRDSWLVLLRSPRDFTKARIRNWVIDIWGAATASSNAEAVLLAGTFSASNGQFALGGTTRTSGTVSALDLTVPFAMSQDDANFVADPARCQ
jgi:hypothetical protein